MMQAGCFETWAATSQHHCADRIVPIGDTEQLMSARTE